jgi:hypothetical protein
MRPISPHREQIRQEANAWPVLMAKCLRALETERADEFLALMRRQRTEMERDLPHGRSLTAPKKTR